jgi:hypothetical protein
MPAHDIATGTPHRAPIDSVRESQKRLHETEEQNRHHGDEDLGGPVAGLGQIVATVDTRRSLARAVERLVALLHAASAVAQPSAAAERRGAPLDRFDTRRRPQERHTRLELGIEIDNRIWQWRTPRHRRGRSACPAACSTGSADRFEYGSRNKRRSELWRVASGAGEQVGHRVRVGGIVVVAMRWWWWRSSAVAIGRGIIAGVVLLLPTSTVRQLEPVIAAQALHTEGDDVAGGAENIGVENDRRGEAQVEGAEANT